MSGARWVALESGRHAHARALAGDQGSLRVGELVLALLVGAFVAFVLAGCAV